MTSLHPPAHRNMARVGTSDKHSICVKSQDLSVWLLTTKSLVRFWLFPCEIYGGRNGNRTGLFPRQYHCTEAAYWYSLMRTTLFWVITQQVVVVSYRRFRTPYISNLQLDSWPLKMEPLDCPETSVRNCHYCLRNNTGEHSSHPLHDRSLKSRKMQTCWPMIELNLNLLASLVNTLRIVTAKTKILQHSMASAAP
jgi:hypothetical protein